MRCDVVNALKEMGIPFFAGREAALQMNITGRTALVQRKAERK